MAGWVRLRVGTEPGSFLCRLDRGDQYSNQSKWHGDRDAGAICRGAVFPPQTLSLVSRDSKVTCEYVPFRRGIAGPFAPIAADDKAWAGMRFRSRPLRSC